MLLFIVIDAKYSKNISGSCKRSWNISMIYETKRLPWCLWNNSDDFSECSSKHLLEHLEYSYLAAFFSINKLWRSLDGAFSLNTSDCSIICFYKINSMWNNEANDNSLKETKSIYHVTVDGNHIVLHLKKLCRRKYCIRKMAWTVFIGRNQLGYSCQGMLKGRESIGSFPIKNKRKM